MGEHLKYPGSTHGQGAQLHQLLPVEIGGRRRADSHLRPLVDQEDKHPERGDEIMPIEVRHR